MRASPRPTKKNVNPATAAAIIVIVLVLVIALYVAFGRKGGSPDEQATAAKLAAAAQINKSQQEHGIPVPKPGQRPVPPGMAPGGSAPAPAPR